MLVRAKKLIIPFFVIVVAALLAKAMLGTREELQTKKVEVALPMVKTIEVKMTDVPVSIVAYGNAKPKHELELASEVTGRVVWVADNFEPGERVRAGEVLLKIDSTDYRLVLAEARAVLATADMALADAVALKRAYSVVILSRLPYRYQQRMQGFLVHSRVCLFQSLSRWGHSSAIGRGGFYASNRGLIARPG